MVSQQLLEYIRANSASYTKEALTAVLVQNGWPETDIAAAFLELEHPAQASAVAPTSPPIDTGSDLLAEMERHRKEQEVLNPNIVVGNSRSVSIQSGPVQQSGMAGLIMRTGLVHSEAEANIVLLGGVLIMLGFCVWMLWPSQTVPPPPQSSISTMTSR